MSDDIEITIRIARNSIPDWVKWIGVSRDGVVNFHSDEPMKAYGWVSRPAYIPNWEETLTPVNGGDDNE